MSAVLTELAPAKVNVCLLLGPTRDSDGRHELVTVMQNLELADELVAEDAEHDVVVCPGVDGENLALTALRRFRERTGWDGPGQRITITKRIPVAAGMAGGSADAAAALRLAARRAGREDDDALLLEIATGLGADVPAQVRPGRWLALGAGEVLEPLPPVAPYGVLVVPVPEPLSTPRVFAEADRLALPRDEIALASGLRGLRPSLDDLPSELCVNELEIAARSLCPAIDDALSDVRAVGADHVMVSGSGPTVLGFFTTFEAAARASARLGRDHHLTRPLR